MWTQIEIVAWPIFRGQTVVNECSVQGLLTQSPPQFDQQLELCGELRPQAGPSGKKYFCFFYRTPNRGIGFIRLGPRSLRKAPQLL